MSPISPPLAAMTARAAARARLAGRNPGYAKESERTIMRALRELVRTRPRIVVFAPDVAIKRVLALPAVRKRLAHPLPRFVDFWGRQVR